MKKTNKNINSSPKYSDISSTSGNPGLGTAMSRGRRSLPAAGAAVALGVVLTLAGVPSAPSAPKSPKSAPVVTAAPKKSTPKFTHSSEMFEAPAPILPSAHGHSGSVSSGNNSSTLDLDFPLLVQEALDKDDEGRDRSDEMATFGLPFPMGQIEEVDGRPALQVEGSSTWQVSTLSSWEDGSVKWALVDLLANVTAEEINSGITLTTDGEGKVDADDIAVIEEGLIRFNTGPLQAEVSTSEAFDLLQRVVVDGLEVVSPEESAGITAIAENGESLQVIDSVTVIESNGPARATTRTDGALADSTGQAVINFTCRLTARAKSRDIEATFTVRNASIDRPQHVRLGGLSLDIVGQLGNGDMTASFNTEAGAQEFVLAEDGQASLYQGFTDESTLGVLGNGKNYAPHIPKIDGQTLEDEGYELRVNDSVVHELGDRDAYPTHGWMTLTGTEASIGVAIKNMASFWPAALEGASDGTVTAGIFTPRNAAGYTFIWRQHESRTATFSFSRTEVDGQAAALRLDNPLVGRAADYDHYDRAGVFAYRLLTLDEQNLAYQAMGLTDADGTPYTVDLKNDKLHVTRFLGAHTTGLNNNRAGIEKQLVGEFLRHGFGGMYLEALDLALYKSEWQIMRSDDFHISEDPGASNDEIPHTKGTDGDSEHRYMEGIIAAYHLTGDQRFLDALNDEAEILEDLWVASNERGMYQGLRALAIVQEFTGSPVLLNELRERVQFNNSQVIDIQSANEGWGWETFASDTGARRYFANHKQCKSEQIEGEIAGQFIEPYITRGFFTSSLGPLAMYHASRVLGIEDAEGQQARGRLRDLAFYTREELLPFQADPTTRQMVYSYGIKTQTVYKWTNHSHPILLGVGEAYLDTGDMAYLEKGVEQLEAASHQDHGSYDTDMYKIEGRLDVQHFLAIYLEANGLGQADGTL